MKFSGSHIPGTLIKYHLASEEPDTEEEIKPLIEMHTEYLEAKADDALEDWPSIEFEVLTEAQKREIASMLSKDVMRGTVKAIHLHCKNPKNVEDPRDNPIKNVKVFTKHVPFWLLSDIVGQLLTIGDIEKN